MGSFDPASVINQKRIQPTNSVTVGEIIMVISKHGIGRFPKVRTGQPDHGRTITSNFECFSKKFLLKTPLLRTYYSNFD